VNKDFPRDSHSDSKLARLSAFVRQYIVKAGELAGGFSRVAVRRMRRDTNRRMARSPVIGGAQQNRPGRKVRDLFGGRYRQ